MTKINLRAFICFLLVAVLALFGWRTTNAASAITVNGATTHQVVDGFGAADTFSTASFIRGASGDTLTAAQTQQIMDMLFSTTTGAGFSIVRNEVGSSSNSGDGDSVKSIEPNNPGGPNATPTYVWNTSDTHLDADQVWFSQTAKSSYGVNTFIADAWSAPFYMKTNNSLIDGGFLCGETGSGAPSCSSGDWRQHYANYLTQYARFYHNAGVDLAYIGYINEPDFSASYTSMNFDTTQASAGNRGTLNSAMTQDIDFIKNYLGPTLAASGLTTKVLCCDATSWANANTYAAGILADANAKNNLGLVTSHGYYTSPNGPVTTPMTAAINAGKHVWETETSTFDAFNTAWDDGSDASGFQWGQNLWTSLVNANVNGYLYWWFAELNSNNSDNEGLININGSNFTVAKRLWAFGNYSRFIRPGATRIDATTGDPNLMVSAFRNTNGSVEVVVLNGNSSNTTATIGLQGVSVGTSATPFLTNASNNLAAQTSIAISGGSMSVTIPARSLVTYNIPAGNGATPTNTPVTPTPTFQPPTNTPIPTTAIPTATRTNTPTGPTPTRTNTPVPPTATRTNTPGATSTSGSLTVQLESGGTDSTQQSQFNYLVKNTGSAAQSNVSVRIYFQLDGTQPVSKYVFEKYWDQSNVATISGPTLASGSIYYYTVSYGTASLAANGTWQFNGALHLSDWSNNFSGANDWWHTGYAMGALPAAFTNTSNIPAYVNGTLVWGSMP